MRPSLTRIPSDSLRATEEVAAEITGCYAAVVPADRTAAGQQYCEIHGGGWLTDVDLCPHQERVADILRGRDEELLGDLEWEHTDFDAISGEPRWQRLVGPWTPRPAFSERGHA